MPRFTLLLIFTLAVLSFTACPGPVSDSSSVPKYSPPTFVIDQTHPSIVKGDSETIHVYAIDEEDGIIGFTVTNTFDELSLNNTSFDAAADIIISAAADAFADTYWIKFETTDSDGYYGAKTMPIDIVEPMS